MSLITKMPDEIKRGDRIVTEDGFTLHYFRVDTVEQDGNHYTFHGWEDGERGELYAVRGEPVEVEIADVYAVN